MKSVIEGAIRRTNFFLTVTIDQTFMTQLRTLFDPAMPVNFDLDSTHASPFLRCGIRQSFDGLTSTQSIWRRDAAARIFVEV